jgi:hypothetical protein
VGFTQAKAVAIALAPDDALRVDQAVEAGLAEARQSLLGAVSERPNGSAVTATHRDRFHCSIV